MNKDIFDILHLDSTDDGFWSALEKRLSWDTISDDAVNDIVKEIISEVRARGDDAVIEYTNRFDRTSVTSMSALEIDKSQLQSALKDIPAEQRVALEKSAQRIHDFHQRQIQEGWRFQEADGTVLGQKVTALDRVGLYVPGGKAAYPSSVLMNAIPAKVAGVAEIIMVVPTPDGEINTLVLAAAAVSGVDRIYTIGGAQAIAALAYGTQTIQPVDKIVGPGNIYVATAKRMVFGQVGIDMIAGPSEILVVCDGQTDPEWITMDLFSQAEHDEDAQSILVSPDAAFLEKVKQCMAKRVCEMERADILKKSLLSRGVVIHVRDMDEAMQVVNYVAPEHLELSVEDPERWLEKVRHAGAIFMGRYTAEALGDYCAGPNHVLPTSRTARFSSPLGVYDFQKRSSLIYCSPEGASALGKIASVFARGEGLTAHARSAEYRIKD